MAEILITDPFINESCGKSYSSGVGRKTTLELLRKHNLSPNTHPRVVDLCAGEGSWAKILIERGWDPNHIVCIDRRRPENPPPEGVKWEYWDLRALATSLRNRTPLPKEVAVYRRSFDLAVMTYGLGSREGRPLFKFFVKPQGQSIIFPYY